MTSGQKTARAVVVTVAPVVAKDVTVKVKTIGTVQAYATVDIKSMVTGPLLSAGFNEGDVVEKGQVLFVIDPRPYQAALDEAKAALARDQASLENSKEIIKRNTPLLQKGYVDKQTFSTLQTNTKTLEATVAADQAAIASAELNLDYATIKAPIAGKTGNISLKPGSIIKANDTLTLVTIAQITPIYVSFSIPQQYLRMIQEAMRQGPMKVRVMMRDNQVEEGLVSFIDNTVNTTTGTIQLKATFENKDHMLWPGEFVTVQIALQQLKHAIVVPTQALVTGQKGFYVYVVDGNGVAQRRLVTPGAVVDDETIIDEGLKSNETIITSGQMRVTDGSQVKISE
jgi:multidrug efflux system membrane fusion protein